MSSQATSPSSLASPITPEAITSEPVPDLGLSREASPVQKTKRSTNRRNLKLKRRAASQYTSSNAAQEAHLQRINFERECKQDRRWLHAQLQRPNRSNISEDSRNQLLRFFKRSAPDLWTTDDTVWNKRVPDMDRDSRLIWERLQDERHAWAREKWDGFANNYVPEKDWWLEKPEKDSGHMAGEKMGKRRFEEINTVSSGAEEVQERQEKKVRTEESDVEDLGALGPISPIPMSPAEFRARFGYS